MTVVRIALLAISVSLAANSAQANPFHSAAVRRAAKRLAKHPKIKRIQSELANTYGVQRRRDEAKALVKSIGIYAAIASVPFAILHYSNHALAFAHALVPTAVLALPTFAAPLAALDARNAMAAKTVLRAHKEGLSVEPQLHAWAKSLDQRVGQVP